MTEDWTRRRPPELSEKLNGALEDVTRLVFNFKKLDYISSAGLRVILLAMQGMAKKGETVLKGAKPEVLEVFEMTGLIDDLKVE